MTLSPYPTVGIVTDADLNENANVFPSLPGREFLAAKTPTFSTGVQKSSSGREVRIARYPSPLYDFKISHEFLRDQPTIEELQSLLAFFNSRLGSYGFFFFYDVSDNTVTDQVVGIGDGVTDIFQLIRSTGAGTVYSNPEPVYAVWKIPVVKVNGAVKTYGADYTIDPWGLLNFAVAPADATTVSWSGHFLFVCRFDNDTMDLQQMVDQIWSQDGLQFVSIKP